MVNWLLSYELKITFSAPVTDHHFSLRCFPAERASQKITNLYITISPEVPLSFGTDGFGNKYVWGTAPQKHDEFVFKVFAQVECNGCSEQEERAEHFLGQFKAPTKLTFMSPAMKEFLASLRLEQYSNDEDKLDALNKAVGEHIKYISGSTNVKTTAEEAFTQCKGVCQDFAHVLLALLRHEGYIARYVAGAIQGEGESHAWVEVLLNGSWIPLDPTHCRRGNENYIAFAVGRDATETNLSKGVFNGFVTQKQEVIVKMEAY